MKKIVSVFLLLSICSFLLTGCGAQQETTEDTVSEQPKIDITTRIGTPYDSDVLEQYGGFSFYCDDEYPTILCGGRNLTDKTIKYICFKPYFINRVGERQDCGFGGYKQMGPINPGEDFYQVISTIERAVGVETVGISEIEIEYMDGTTERGSYNFQTSKVNDLLKGID